MKKKEDNISNQPIIFNISYTPYKVKKNATEEEKRKFERERPYYEMSDSGNNIYKYMTSDRKLNGENSKTVKTLLEYFEKSTGVFNGDGMISKEELKKIKERAKAPKNLWHGFISLNEEMSYKIDAPEKCMHLVKRNFGAFFRDMGLDPKNVDLICALHKDKPNHLHIHFWFAEKEPKRKYRKKETEYVHKGKVEKAVLDRMHVRLNLYVTDKEYGLRFGRDDAIKKLAEIANTESPFISKNEIRQAIVDLAKEIPKGASFWYGKKDMEPYETKVDEIVKKIILFSEPAREANLRYRNKIADLQNRIDDICNGSGNDKNNYKIDPKNITIIDEIEYDYKRRQGNAILDAVKRIKPEIYEPKGKHKVNDNNLKRRLNISRYRIGKIVDGLISLFANGDGPIFQRDFSTRLQEIEEEIKDKREKEQRETEAKEEYIRRKYNYGK